MNSKTDEDNAMDGVTSYQEQLGTDDLGLIGLCTDIRLCHDLAKQLSHYLYFFSFSFLLDLLHIRSVGKCHVT